MVGRRLVPAGDAQPGHSCWAGVAVPWAPLSSPGRPPPSFPPPVAQTQRKGWAAARTLSAAGRLLRSCWPVLLLAAGGIGKGQREERAPCVPSPLCWGKPGAQPTGPCSRVGRGSAAPAPEALEQIHAGLGVHRAVTKLTPSERALQSACSHLGLHDRARVCVCRYTCARTLTGRSPRGSGNASLSQKPCDPRRCPDQPHYTGREALGGPSSPAHCQPRVCGASPGVSCASLHPRAR